tara:strand:+ start:77 stop:571 length:495 start_codon:yes stop_codon:yes gene_type:complete
MSNLRNKLIRLAHQKPELRKHLLPLLSKQAAPKMAPKIKSKAEAKIIENTRWQDWNPVRLPDEPAKYFLNDPKLIKPKLSELKPIRAREKGVANANKFMWLAYNGFKPKRKPISLKREKDGSYTILDGNSTYANAKANGWKVMWGVLVEDDFVDSYNNDKDNDK